MVFAYPARPALKTKYITKQKYGPNILQRVVNIAMLLLVIYFKLKQQLLWIFPYAIATR
jgi:hypothetical protein